MIARTSRWIRCNMVVQNITKNRTMSLKYEAEHILSTLFRICDIWISKDVPQVLFTISWHWLKFQMLCKISLCVLNCICSLMLLPTLSQSNGYTGQCTAESTQNKVLLCEVLHSISHLYRVSACWLDTNFYLNLQ